MKKYHLILSALTLAVQLARADILLINSAQAYLPDSVVISDAKTITPVVIDPRDYPVVSLSANLFAKDVNRVTGHQPQIINQPVGRQLIIAGTLGHSETIDKLVASGKLKNLDQIKGKWETTIVQVVMNPFPDVDRALVIVGSDRRGTAYGLMQLSEKIGVSPWNWWADVPAQHHDSIAIQVSGIQTDSPGVKYRGIFINDEDWGLNAWAKSTFDPEFKNIGPKTYDKVFELMLRLRLNYIWPAMHSCSTEFGLVPENITLADKYAIVAGASHCEPMLCNNAKWNVRESGPWDYSINRDTIHTYWEKMVAARGTQEAVWTIGIRGIHDAPMNGPKDIPSRIKLVSQVIADQRELLNKHVTKDWGQIVQCFVPYKEVQPIYDAGLSVPEDVTLVWADDNFGYIRRFSSTDERKRSGGSGFYYHLSYYGAPHSYTWINTVAPAQMWLEMHKAWDNDARTMWMMNVGDIKPMEIGIDYYSKLAWNPQGLGFDSQKTFLHDFAAKTFSPDSAASITSLLNEFYRLGTIRKPELMNRSWAMSLTQSEAAELSNAYQSLITKTDEIEKSLPAASREAFTQLIGFPARILGSSGLIFLADRNIQSSKDIDANQSEITRQTDYINAQVDHYNNQMAGGKWKLMMPGMVTGKKINQWNSQVRWPWGETPATSQSATAPAIPTPVKTSNPFENRTWRAAVKCDFNTTSHPARWTEIIGLGGTGHAMSLQPATLETSFNPETDLAKAPTLGFNFQSQAGDSDAYIDFLPTFRLVPGMKLRVAIQLDDSPAQLMEIPGSSGTEDERGNVRSNAVQANYARLRVPLPKLPEGKHVLKIIAVDPGATIDRVSLP